MATARRSTGRKRMLGLRHHRHRHPGDLVQRTAAKIDPPSGPAIADLVYKQHFADISTSSPPRRRRVRHHPTWQAATKHQFPCGAQLLLVMHILRMAPLASTRATSLPCLFKSPPERRCRRTTVQLIVAIRSATGAPTPRRARSIRGDRFVQQAEAETAMSSFLTRRVKGPTACRVCRRDQYTVR